MDRYGTYYPNAKVSVLYTDFFDPYAKGDATSDDAYSGSLDFYFTGRYATRNGGVAVDERADRSARVGSLREAYDTPIDVSAGVTFDDVQRLVLERTVANLTELLRGSQQRELVVLVHGFNDANPSGDFARLRQAIDSHVGARTPVFLEVYWDGLTANQASPPTSGIWGRAQRNSAYVAMALRQLLVKLPKETRIRVVTHSLGASVGTGALFNCTSKWRDDGANIPGYRRLLDSVPAPTQADIRLGMIAPAIPGVTTFKDFNNRGWTVDSTTNNIGRIVVGYNWNDYAVTKRWFWGDLLSKRMGSTSLGSDALTKRTGEVAATRDELIKLGYATAIDEMYWTIPFNEFERGKEKEQHGVYYYMKKTPEFDQFMIALFD